MSLLIIGLSEIVYKYSKIIMVKYFQKLNKICDKIRNLYFNYKNIMKCDEIIVSNPSRPTNIFISISHYRNIFNEIDKWFRHGNYDITKNKEILSFLTADDIYEYYCLLNIIQLLKKINYIENETNRKCYIYNVPNDLYNDVKYIILDSKWSKYETIKNYRFNEAAMKYLFSTKDQINLCQTASLWLLQGKDSMYKKNVFCYNKSEISKTLNNSFQKSSDIVKLTPNSGTKYFEDILNELL